MTGYNFQSRFVEPIRKGQKRKTSRRLGVRRHARPGDRLQLYTGMRTKSCSKILAKDPICIAVHPAIFDLQMPDKPIIEIAGKLIKGQDLDHFVFREGFVATADFVVSFIETYSAFEDEMLVISW